MRKTPSKNSSRFWETSDELTFLQGIATWGIKPRPEGPMLYNYINSGRKNWGLVNKKKVMEYANKRLKELRKEAGYE